MKVSIEEWRKIKDYSTGEYSMRELASKYNTSNGYVCNVVNNQIRVNI
jgi:predicted DNA-binding protein YlxM (UPF0122 family)